MTATNDSGKLRLSNLSTSDLTLVGATAAGVVNGDTGVANTTTIGGNVVRRNLVKQYNDLRDQLDKLADDASYNGINLLRGDKLRIIFNELGTSTIAVQAQDEFGVPTADQYHDLGIDFLLNQDVDADDSIDGSWMTSPRRSTCSDRRRRASDRTCRSWKFAPSSPSR